jgi:pyruvate kinase
VWVVALSPASAVCQGLAFSYGVYPVQLDADPENWSDFACAWLAEHGLPSGIAMLVSGPSSRHPQANYRLEFMRLGEVAGAPKPGPAG